MTRRLNFILVFLFIGTCALDAQIRSAFGLELDSTWNYVEINLANGKLTGNWRKSKLIGRNQFNLPVYEDNAVVFKFTGTQISGSGKGEKKWDIKFQNPEAPYYPLTTGGKDVWTLKPKDKYSSILEITTLLITSSGQVSKRVLRLNEQSEGD
jgi:hypothetical protein